MNARHFQRNTRQREVIVEELRKLDTHPSAVGLHEIVKRRLPKISLGTVYRNLEILAHAGKIRKLDISGVEARFDAKMEPHDHVRCVRCGRVDDIFGLRKDFVEPDFKNQTGYVILGHRLEFYGICPSCNEAGVARGRAIRHQGGYQDAEQED